MKINSTILVLLIALPFLFLSCGTQQQADLVLINGKVVTVDEQLPEVEALAVVGNTIKAVGSNEQMKAYIGSSTKVIDLNGKLAVPGFIEGHGHFISLGRAQMILDLTKVKNWGEIVAMVAEAAKKAEPGAWIFGRGWHQEKWNRLPANHIDGLPTHQSLSDVSPDNPVYLTHASGHASFANAAALKSAGIDADTPDPAGGTIVRDAQGQPIGMLRENAQDIVEEAIDAYQKQRSAEEITAERREQIKLAGQECLSKGVTTFHDAGSSFETIDFFKTLADEGRLPVRLYVMVRHESNETMAAKLPEYRTVNYGDSFLTVRAIKRQIDGALGAHGAWLLEPYEDLPESVGLVLEPIEEITRTCEIAIEHGYQVNTHAIGDRANREVLDIYQKIFAAHPDKEDLRWRIEHAQHLHPDEISRFADLQVIASMQGVHCTSDGPWVSKRLGEKRSAEGAYIWRDLWDAGVIVTNGTDTPVEDVSPIASFYATVTRKMANGEAFYPQQKLTRAEALKSYTLNNAFAAFEEDLKGSLSPGKLADIVVLSKDIMTVPDDEIPDAEVVYTIVDGKVVYEKSKSDN